MYFSSLFISIGAVCSAVMHICEIGMQTHVHLEVAYTICCVFVLIAIFFSTQWLLCDSPVSRWEVCLKHGTRSLQKSLIIHDDPHNSGEGRLNFRASASVAPSHTSALLLHSTFSPPNHHNPARHTPRTAGNTLHSRPTRSLMTSIHRPTTLLPHCRP